MRKFIARRIVTSLVALIISTMVIFAISRMMGDPRVNLLPAQGYGLNQSEWEAAGRRLHLDKAIPIQYLFWLGDVLRGDLGQDLVDRREITAKLIPKLGPTLLLAISAWIFATVIGPPLGVLAAVKRGSIWDLLGRSIAISGQSLPTFWVGILGILIFAVWLRWLPVGTMGEGIPIRHLVMPVFTLGWLAMAGYVRLVRSSMLEVLDSEYIKLARAKGVGEFSVIWKHGFRNAVIAPLTYGSLLLAGLITGSVAVETVFAWPGIARWAVEAVFTNNLPVLVAVTLMFTVLFVVTNFLVDILYALADPRVRY
jgi:peptide/nickel transport system permease protein